MAKTVEVHSDGMCYWMRWMAVFFGAAMLYWMGGHLRGETPSPVYQTLIAVACLGGIFLTFLHRPKSYRLVLKDDELIVEKLPSGRVKGVFPLKDLRYATIRSSGHLLNLSVLRIVVRTKQTTKAYGPIYSNGLDSVSSAAVGRLLPRIARPDFSHISKTS
ncbi:MAG: hypothetical protein ACI9DF_004800 [Verrucomicrobiales bacterium]|jgi:hypothetical protein